MTEKQLYWKDFYDKNASIINKPSDFCCFILNYFKYNNFKIMDAGCGNGRDSYVLAINHNVVGIDISSYLPKNTDNCLFIIDNFCTYNKDEFDLIYSRFTFHSITNEEQEIFVKSISKVNTYLCIETRSTKSNNDYRYFGDTHYRNLTDSVYLKKLLIDNNFEILYFEESNDLAIYKNENPICIRVICRKT